MEKEPRDNIIKCIEILLQKGAKPISPHPVFPQIAVALAAQAGDLEVLQLLEKYKASLEVDFMGMSLLQLAQSSKNFASNPVIPYLLSKQSAPQPTL